MCLHGEDEIKLLEKIILPLININIPEISHQHGFKTGHIKTTALHQLTHHIATGFYKKQSPLRTITIAIDISKAFDTVNHNTLIDKFLETNIPPLIMKFIANYIKVHLAYSLCNNTTSFPKQFKSGVPQGGVLFPTLFNIYMPDIPIPVDEHTIKHNMKTIHTSIVQDHLYQRPFNKLLNSPTPDIDKTEETLPHITRRRLAQLRTDKFPLLLVYLNKIDEISHLTEDCPVCNSDRHGANIFLTFLTSRQAWSRRICG